jgi:ADP-ribose pyrophosphatase YjhB (NUDIX family)
MKAIDRFILASVLVGLLVNLGSAFLSSQLPRLNEYAAIVLGVAVCIWGLYRLIEVILRYTRYGRYAVLVLFLNSKLEILLVRHPFHKRLIPPGGRLQQWELPHLAVAKRLIKEAGIDDFEFHPKFHHLNGPISDVVERVPQPYSVQIEHRRQRGLVKFHYTFVYVCKFRGEDKQLAHVESYQPRWISLEEIGKLQRDLIPFDDVLLQYQEILNKIR